jgi:hypothetical protein
LQEPRINKVKVIQEQIDTLRRDNRRVCAALISYWQTGLAFIVFSGISIYNILSDQKIDLIIGSVGGAIISLAYWITWSYYLIQDWKRES